MDAEEIVKVLDKDQGVKFECQRSGDEIVLLKDKVACGHYRPNNNRLSRCCYAKDIAGGAKTQHRLYDLKE